VKALGAAALRAALLAGCGGSGGGKVAHVGDETITRKQLDAVVAHFRTVARNEGESYSGVA
jgi:hypothetical protein